MQLIAMQMVSVPDVDQNLKTVESLLQRIAVSQPTLVVLPECFAFFGARDRDVLAIAETAGDGTIQNALSKLAKAYGVWLVAGTIPIIASDKKFSAACLVYNDAGEVAGRYDKIHLFDVEVPDKTKSYRESRYTQPGSQCLVLPSTPFGRLAIAVCYDIRFAGQFNAMAPFDVLALPAAFTAKTGQAHWRPLLQCRSIENQCYTVAANQGGNHLNGRETYGHSCIYSPWGELLAEKSQGEGIVYAEGDLGYIESIRSKMPVIEQNRFRSNFE